MIDMRLCRVNVRKGYAFPKVLIMTVRGCASNSFTISTVRVSNRFFL